MIENVERNSGKMLVDYEEFRGRGGIEKMLKIDSEKLVIVEEGNEIVLWDILGGMEEWRVKVQGKVKGLFIE